MGNKNPAKVNNCILAKNESYNYSGILSVADMVDNLKSLLASSSANFLKLSN